MNPRSDVSSLVCSEGLLLPLDAEGRKGSPERRSLKLFPGEETSIILVVYAHVGARLAGVPFLPFSLPPSVLRCRRRNWGTGQRQVDNGARKLKCAIKSSLFASLERALLYMYISYCKKISLNSLHFDWWPVNPRHFDLDRFVSASLAAFPHM